MTLFGRRRYWCLTCDADSPRRITNRAYEAHLMAHKFRAGTRWETR